MYQYRVAVPVTYSDELVSILNQEASVDLEAVMPAPSDSGADDPLAVHMSSPMAVLLIYGATIDSVATVKSWLDGRREAAAIDVRGEDPPGQFGFSFHAHTLDEIRDWVSSRVSQSSLS